MRVHLRVGNRVREEVDPAEHEVCCHRLAYPANSEGAEGDAELNCRQEVLNVMLKAADGACAGNLVGEELFDAGIASADEGEFSGHKEGVGQNQHSDGDNLEKGQTVHPGCEDSISGCFDRALTGVIHIRATRAYEPKSP
jgi:hypothetical protein